MALPLVFAVVIVLPIAVFTSLGVCAMISVFGLCFFNRKIWFIVPDGNYNSKPQVNGDGFSLRSDRRDVQCKQTVCNGCNDAIVDGDTACPIYPFRS